jgi:hypothetical protein
MHPTRFRSRNEAEAQDSGGSVVFLVRSVCFIIRKGACKTLDENDDMNHVFSCLTTIAADDVPTQSHLSFASSLPSTSTTILLVREELSAVLYGISELSLSP